MALISLSAALAAYAEQLKPLATETRPLESALGQVLASDVCSAVALPLFDQSAVDGYALRAADTKSASVTHPARLQLAGLMAAGDGPHAALAAGTAVRIFTGAMLPAGADSIARQEIVQRDGGQLLLPAPLAVGEDLRRRGEELPEGHVLARAGQRLHAGLIAALAMSGVASVLVHRRPRISVLVTGDELRDIGATLAPGQIYDSNGPMVRAWLRSHGHTQITWKRVIDTEAAVTDALQTALANSDVVITTGGVSVGDRDFIPQVAEKLGVKKVFWKVAQKPGKPLWFGTREGHALIGLPGNPAAVLIGLALHVRRLLEVIEGVANPAPHFHWGSLSQALPPDADRDRLLRVVIAGGSADNTATRLELLPRQGSHMLSNLATAGGLAWVPHTDASVAAGTALRWTPLFGS